VWTSRKVSLLQDHFAGILADKQAKYNVGVPAAEKPKASDPKTKALRAETIGLILLSVLVLIITVIRYWGEIPWSVW